MRSGGRTSIRFLLWGVLCCIILVAGMALVGMLFVRQDYKDHPEIRVFESIEPGMTEHQVRALVGEPGAVYDKATAPKHYYVSGYTFEKRAITNKVLIYWFGGDLIAYIYISPTGRVEHVFIGGS